MVKHQYLKNVVTLEINREKCVGCGICLTVCPHRVLAVDSDKVIIVDRDACMECGACARNCPLGAISVKAGVGCAAAVINSRIKGGSPCCGESEDGSPSCCG